MTSINTLLKSKLLAYRQCEKRLWLEVKHPELLQDSSLTQASYQVGNQVGDLAQEIYDPEHQGTLIYPQEEGFKSAFLRTENLMNSRKPIFEAAFSAGGALALVDVMLPSNKRGKINWKMIEVKSSTKVKDYHRDDVAIQAYIAKQTGIELEKIELACIDNKWVYPGENNYQNLLKETDLTNEAFSRKEEVKTWIEEAQKITRKTKEPAVKTGAHCDHPYPCGFYEHCSKDDPQVEFPIHWLPDIRTKALKSAIVDNEIVDICDAPQELLNTLQQRVKEHTLANSVYFDKAGAAEDLSAYKLPAYFLDFETIRFAVPIWKGTRPYQQIPFQFSLHKLGRNNDLTHTEFLEISGEDPSQSIAEALVKQCGKTGPIYVYSANFEKTRIKELANHFPKLKKELLVLNERIVDLRPIAKNRYYHPSQEGSWSLKKVLPAIVPELNYDDLEGVQDGGMAMGAFLEAIHETTSKERKTEINHQLLKYCELDTFALVKIWQAFTDNKITNIKNYE